MKQQPTTNKPPATSAQLSVIHGLQSAGQAAFISLCVGIGQYLVTGNINLTTLLTVLGASFFGAGTMVYKSLSSNPQLAQAALDTANEALAKVEQVAPWIAQDIARMQKPPVVNLPRTDSTAYIPPSPPALSQQPQQSGGGMPVDYYTRGYNQNVASMETQSVPAYPGTVPMAAYNLQTGQNMPPAANTQRPG